MAQSSTFNASSADGYERLMGRWSRRLAVPFLEFVKVSDGDRVLDVGCGTGSLTFAAAEFAEAKEVVGVDLAAAYIERARRDCADERITFHQGDAFDLPLDDGAFDRVFCFLVLQFIPDPARAIAEMRRKTRPGGIAAAAVWDVRGGLVFNRIFFDTAAAVVPEAAERRKQNYTRPLTRPGELAEAWRTAGFGDTQEAMLTIRMDYDSFADYWGPFDGKDGPGAALMGELSGDQGALVKDRVRLAYLDGEDDGPRSYAATAWAVKGVAP
jgi:SAM-dependent methyltransferase